MKRLALAGVLSTTTDEQKKKNQTKPTKIKLNTLSMLAGTYVCMYPIFPPVEYKEEPHEH